eukprot:TRINITY_DN7134_c0_g1_i1.p1 TRINITY_DN7134_c0_g1~~TRINITY_DN7134_c0_g1_i1.p1  ORF type:complete len:277 (-),score=-46.41 TRINITY_DN7134_c0_g1_i1:2-832(-)
MSYIFYNSQSSLGFWEPHSSSVDFCEPNYLHSIYIAETHNVWSSVYISLLPILGMIFCNPLNEWRTIVMYLTLFCVGIGSCFLHGTLHWLSQSADEIPMLWLNLSFIFALYNLGNSRPRKSVSYTGILLFGIGILQTIGYFTMRHIYDFFLFSFISSLLIVILWTIYIVFRDIHSTDYPIRLYLFKNAMYSFVFFGASLWIYEMNHCEHLLPYYISMNGITFHILWHLGSGTGAYLLILLMIAVRIQTIGYQAEIEWILYGIFPIIKKTNPKVLLT